MMQLVRPIGSAKLALGMALEDLSASEMQAATGVSPAALYEASHPGKKKQPALEQCAELAAALVAKGRPDVLTTFFEQHRDATLARLGGALAHVPCAPQERVIEVMQEVGDVAGAVRQALGDGVLDAADRDRIRREIVEAKAALEALERDLAASTGPGAAPAAGPLAFVRKGGNT